MDYRIDHQKRLKCQKWADRVKRYWPQFLAIFVDLLAIVTLIIFAFQIKNKTTLEQIYFYELSALVVFLLVYVIVQEYRYSRKARYSEAMFGLHSCIHFLRDFHFDLKNIQKDFDCKNALSDVITSLTNSFSIVTGTHCRGCIKMLEIRNKTLDDFQKINNPKERVKYLFVNTYCRDAQTAYTKSDEDSSNIYVHPVIGNTDFLDLYLRTELRCFFLNNLSTLKGYQNSSLQKDDSELPYQSTIVWPIRKLVYEQDCKKHNPYILNREQDIIGYLCIDSSGRNIFRKRYDFEMGAIIADALFTFLKNYHNYLAKLKEEDKI